VDDDRTTRSRIRDAAIACFADAGVDGTSVRTIAATAEVSPALVIHHFGSKDALRVACDRHVADTIRANKSEAMAAGTGIDPLGAMRDAADGPPITRYLARTLGDDSPHVAALVDEMVEDAVAYTEQGVTSGALRPSDDPRGRAAVLVVWSLGALVLHEHVARLTGADLAAGLDPEQLQGYLAPALEIMAGIFTPEMAAALRDAFHTDADPTTPSHQETSP
jgi:AcrR family transcriptional regulator